MNVSVPLLALDPSSTHIGWALLGPGPSYITSGVWKIPDAPSDQRVPMAGDAVRSIISQRCPVRPALVLIEIPDFIASYARPSIVPFFRAVGAAEYATYLCGLPMDYVRGSKHKAGKQKAKQSFFQIVHRYPTTDDESDALYVGWEYLAARTPAAAPVWPPQ